MTSKTPRSTDLDEHSKILLIQINHSNAGFFAYVTFAINQIIYAEKHGLRPVVHFGPWSVDGPNAFYDPGHGDNTWEYYFEPVAGLSSAELQAKLQSPEDPLTESDITRLTVEEQWHVHLGEPDSIYNYPYGLNTDKAEGDSRAWYQEQRRKANAIIRKYIRIKPEILAEVETFTREHFEGHHVLGIHMRGTDKGTAHAPAHLMRVKKPVDYYPLIDRHLAQHAGCKIFLATDQRQFVEDLREKYGDRVLALDVIRGSSSVNPFQQSDGKNYRKGKEVLIDCLLLSHCDFLLKCTSAVGEYAMYFDPELECIDVNHLGGGASVSDRAAVALARARYGFRRGLSEIRAKGASRSDMLRNLAAYNPIGLLLYPAIERRRFSRNPLVQLLVGAKDYGWAAVFPDRAPMDLVRHRSRVRAKRQGATIYEPHHARRAKVVEVRTDGDTAIGFATMFLRAIRGLHFADAHALEPVVTIDQTFSPYYDAARGPNIWDYYFEPVSDLRSEQIESIDRHGLVLLEPRLQFHTWLGDEPRKPWEPGDEERDPGFERRRVIGAQVVDRHVRVKPEIFERVDRFEREHFAGHPTLGVHVRGTDWGSEGAFPARLHTIITPASYFPLVDRFLEEQPEARVFVATDQQQFLDAFVERYGEQAIFTKALRSRNDTCPAVLEGKRSAERGEEILVDILLLARTRFLLRCASAVGEAACYFNAKLPSVDLSVPVRTDEIEFEA